MKKFLCLNQPRKRSLSTLSDSSQVVICGSGIVGKSIAYHLAEEGWKDVTVIEQNRIGSGTSTCGSGVVGLFREYSERWVAIQSLNVLRKLQNIGYDLGLRKCGSLNLAQTRERAIALKRRIAYMKPSGMHCEWINRHDVRTRHPFLFTDDLEGAVWFPEDAVADPQAVSKALFELSQFQGVKYVENCEVLSIESSTDLKSQVTPRVDCIHTSLGPIKCEYFVNAAGLWARQLGEKSNPRIRVPAFSAEHYFLNSKPMMEADDNLPIVRDYDNFCFCYTKNQQFVLGGFEPLAKISFENGVSREWTQGSADDDHFEATKKNLMRRIPLLQKASFNALLNVPGSFTPDGLWVLGETKEIDNYFVATGMNGNAMQGGVGAGLEIAQWIVNGAPSTQMLPFDVRRFLDLHNNRRYLKERIKEVVGWHYSINYPYQSEFELARKLRCSPIYVEQEARGAVFGVRMGFERPSYFDLSHKRGDDAAKMPAGTFYKPSFMDCIKDEYLACREGVALLDLSSFTKIEIKTTGINKRKKFDAMESAQEMENPVVEYLQKLSCNDVDVPVGGIVHTGMHNHAGGYENDCLLIRNTENSYLMLAPTLQETRVMDWMERQITSDIFVSVSDITSMYSVLSVIGPKSRDMLSMICNSDLSYHGQKARMVKIAYASEVLLLSFTHVGEPGYTMIVPSEYTLHIYNNLMKVGQDYGVKNIGMITLKTLRVEKFIPFWADEIDSTTNPFEIGRGYRVKFNKNYSIGKAALQQEANLGPKKRLVQFLMGSEYDSDVHVWPWGSEPIYRNGIHVGEVTSSGYGFSLGKMVCLGWVRHPTGGVVTSDFIQKDANFEIDIAGVKYSAHACIQPPKIPVASMDSLASSYRPNVRADILKSN